MADTVKLDATNTEIARQLADGRKPFSQIAEELGITENTVRSRVNKMVNDGILKIQGLINPQALSDVQIVFTGFRMNTRDLEKKCHEFLKLRGVISASVVTGRYDIIVQIMLSDSAGFTLLDFFKSELVKVNDIAEAETFVIYQSHNLNVPYVL